MPLIGYISNSSIRETPKNQGRTLRRAGCSVIFRERQGRDFHCRPVLSKILDIMSQDDTLVVLRVDLVASAPGDLAKLAHRLRRVGAHFRAIENFINTSPPNRTHSLQDLKEFNLLTNPNFETNEDLPKNEVAHNQKSSAVSERTRSQDLSEYVKSLDKTSSEWFPHVLRLRPSTSWEGVLLTINASLPPHRHWSKRQLLKAVRAYAEEGLLSRGVLGRVRMQEPDARLPAIVATIKNTNPDMTLRDISARLEEMKEITSKGSTKWNLSSVYTLLLRAKALGLLHSPQKK